MITEEQIWQYLDGDLSLADRNKFEQALTNDKQASDLFHQISALHLSLKTDTQLAPSLGFTDRVMASVGTAPATGFSLKPYLLFIMPTLLVTIILGGLLYWGGFTFTYPLAYNLPMPDLAHFGIYFVVADILLLAYFWEDLSEYRLNRKAHFA